MKKILYITGICLLIIIQSFAQTNITSTIQVFPYQKTTEATASLAAMNNWEASEWKAFFKLLDDTAQKTKATYALHAYVNQIANGDKRAAFAKQLLKQKRKDYFQLNKERWNQYGKDRAKIDPVYRIKVHMRKVLIKALNGTSKSKKTEDILGCSFSEFKEYIEDQFDPWMNWDNKGLYNGDFNYGWDIDHIVPLCTAKSPEEVLSLNHYTNLRPLCSHVNRNIKRDKHE